MIDGALSFKKLQPILFSIPNRSYCSVGEKLAKARGVGKELVKWAVGLDKRLFQGLRQTNRFSHHVCV